jgi:hypothetical protein
MSQYIISSFGGPHNRQCGRPSLNILPAEVPRNPACYKIAVKDGQSTFHMGTASHSCSIMLRYDRPGGVGLAPGVKMEPVSPAMAALATPALNMKNLLVVLRTILHGSERTQSRLLRFSQAFYTRDVEAFVRSISPQRSEMLATGQIPKHDRPIIPTACQHRPIGTSPKRLNDALVRFTYE